jgi:tRNA(Ile2) C34 agmatinyltransferase TiaS
MNTIPIFPFEGSKRVIVNCPNCGEHDNSIGKNEEFEKCRRCGYNDCEVLKEEVFCDGSWVDLG